MRLITLLFSIAFLSSACNTAPEESGAKAKTPSQQEKEHAHSLKKDEQSVTVREVMKANGQLGPGRGTLIIDIQPPKGAELTEGAPFRLSAKGSDLTFPEAINTKLQLTDLPARLPLDVADGAQGPVELDLTYYYCTKGNDASCRPERAKVTVEIDLSGSSAGGEAHLIHRPKA